MNYLSLVYFGSEIDFPKGILTELNIIKFESANEQYNGLYAVESRYGRLEYRKLNLRIDPNDNLDWIIYKYLNQEELNYIKNDAGLRKVYILLHNYINQDYLIDLAEGHNLNIALICDSGNINIKSKSQIENSKFSSNQEYFYIQKPKIVKTKSVQAEASNANYLLLLFMPIFRFLLNPINELSRYSIILREGNLRILSRFFELILFISYLLKVLIYNPFEGFFRKIYFILYRFFGTARVLIIKIGFFIRHIVLMSWYKIYGLSIDLKNAWKRVLDLFIETVFYKFIHKIYHNYIVKFISWLWVSIFSKIIFDFFVKYFFYGILHNFYHSYLKKILTWVWVNIFSKFIFDFLVKHLFYGILHNFYHSYIKKILTWVWVNVVSILIYDYFVKYFVYGLVYKIIWGFFVKRILIKNIYYGLIMPIFSFIWLKLISPFLFNFIVGVIFYKLFYSFIYGRILNGMFIHSFKKYVIGVFYYRFIINIFFGKLIDGILIQKVIYKFFWQKIYCDILVPCYGVFKVKIVNPIYYGLRYHYIPLIYSTIRNFIVFRIRHFLLMSYFKMYGLVFDTALIIYRFTKLYILWPVRKMYWFFKFQYYKRIKKSSVK